MKLVVIDDNKTRRDSFSNLLIPTDQKFEKVGEGLRNGYANIDNKVDLHDCDLLLIHSGNTFIQEFVNEMNEKYPDLLIVMYSGGNTIVLNRFMKNLKIERDGGTGFKYEFNLSDPENVLAISRAITNASGLSLESAIGKYKKSKSVKDLFDALDKFDPSLEAKLDLLHSCLSPLYENGKYFINISEIPDNIKYLTISHKDVVKKYEDNPPTIQKYLEDVPGGDPFDENLITWLTILRDELLKDY